MSGKIIHPKRIQRKSRRHKVHQADMSGNVYRVTSGTSSKTYTVHVSQEAHLGAVTFAGARCSCDWGKYRRSDDGFRSGCSHVVAVYDHIAHEEQERVVSAWGNLDDAQRQHRPITVIGDGVLLTGRRNGALAESRTLLHDCEAERLI
jgi:hypothetical protein